MFICLWSLAALAEAVEAARLADAAAPGLARELCV